MVSSPDAETWDAEQQRIRDEANAARSEAAKGNQNAAKPKGENSPPTPSGRSVSQPEQPSADAAKPAEKPKSKPRGKGSAAKAKASGTNRGSVEKWTKDARKAEKDEQKAKALDLWLDCHSQQAIAEQVGVDQKTVSNWLKEKTNEFANSLPPGATKDQPWGHVQHFDVWQFQTSSKEHGGQSYFGALPPQVIVPRPRLFTNPARRKPPAASLFRFAQEWTPAGSQEAIRVTAASL